MKPCSQACERNQGPILRVLERVFADRRRVLEIGSGTGQHAVHFAARLAHLTWQPSDLPECHTGIASWIAEAGVPNVLAPVAIDVNTLDWPVARFDAIFSANVVHIVAWSAVESMFAGIGRHLQTGGVLALYGPFNYGGRFTSAGNAEFDAWLRARNPASGIRDVEAIVALARRHGLDLREDTAMPANNRTLVWQRSSVSG